MKLFLTILFLSSYSFLMAQNTSSAVKYDDRLLEVYEKTYLEDLAETRPFMIQRWNFMLDNAYFIADFPDEKLSADYPVIEIDDVENINILKLIAEQQLSRDRDQQKFYRINGTNKHLVLYAVNSVVKKMNKHLNRTYK